MISFNLLIIMFYGKYIKQIVYISLGKCIIIGNILLVLIKRYIVECFQNRKRMDFDYEMYMLGLLNVSE